MVAEHDQTCLVTSPCSVPLLVCSAGTPPKRLLQQIEPRRLEIVERYRRLGWLQRGHETITTRLVPREEHCQNLLKRLWRCRRLGASELGYLLRFKAEFPDLLTAYQPQIVGPDGVILQDFELVFSNPWARFMEHVHGRQGVQMDGTYCTNSLKFCVLGRGVVNSTGGFTATSIGISSSAEGAASVGFFCAASHAAVEADARSAGIQPPLPPKYIIDKSKVSGACEWARNVRGGKRAVGP